MSLGDIYEDKVLDALFGGVALTVPANFELLLSTTAPNDDGTNITEPVGNGYARLVIANDLTTWIASAGGSKSNDIDLTFVVPSGPWGLITHWALLDVIGGIYVQSGAMNPQREILAGDLFKFFVGQLIITAD